MTEEAREELPDGTLALRRKKAYPVSKDPGWMLTTILASMKLMNLIVLYYQIFNAVTSKMGKYGIMVSWMLIQTMMGQVWLRMSMWSLDAKSGYFLNYSFVFSFEMTAAIMLLKWEWPTMWFAYVAFNFIMKFAAQVKLWGELKLMCWAKDYEHKKRGLPIFHIMRKTHLNTALAFCSVFVFGVLLSRLVIFLLVVMEPGDSDTHLGGALVFGMELNRTIPVLTK